MTSTGLDAPGDVIVAIGETSIDGVEEFLGVLRPGEPRQELDVKVVRGRHERTIKLRLGER
jgi:S1-C subfamily serine protease